MGLFLSFGATMNAQTEVSSDAPKLDLTLAKAISIALEENPTIKVAEKDIELKKIADKEAWMNLLPTLDAQLALSHSITVAEIRTSMGTFKMGMDGTTTAQGSLTLALPIFAPAIYKNMKMTKDDILLAQEAARGSKLDLIKQVTKAYYAALLAKNSVDVVQKAYDVAAEKFRVVDAKYQVGKASEYDQLSASVQMRSMKSSLVSTQTGLKLALLQLQVLMGVTESVNININDDLNNYSKNLKVEDEFTLAMELDNNTGLRQLNYSEKMLGHARSILKTNFMPTIGLQLTGQYQSMSNDNWNLFKYHYSPSSSLAIAVSIPIFKASNFTKLKSNQLQLMQLQDTRQNTINQLRMAIASYRSNMYSTIDQANSNMLAVEQASKAVDIASKRYEVGNGTILELNQSQTALTQAELTYSQSIYDFLVSKADLDYTLGRETYLK
ncbi:MAG: TolC family protein [Bacteroidaceae bacterium]|nr:TolC family protein [Bacteroidaceae bacterium]